MSKVVRCEFTGSWIIFWLLCACIIGIPAAILYLINGTVRIETEMEDPEQFLAEYRAGKAGR